MKRGAGAGVIQRFLGFLREHSLTGSTVGIGFSGGSDSTALAICASEAHRAGALSPVLLHVDHQVRPDSSNDRTVVRLTAVSLGLELIELTAQSLSAESTEAEMRVARYRALAGAMDPLASTIVMTGHHARDQAETVLLHLVRGQGMEGAAGMHPREIVSFDSFSLDLVRPLLVEEPVELSNLVAEYRLSVVDDPTNRNVEFARNLIRHEVLPHLSQINPGAVGHIARSAEIARAEDQAMSAETERAAGEVARRGSLDGTALSALPVAYQRRIIRLWVTRTTGLEPGFDRTEALRELANSGTGSVSIQIGEGWSARQSRRRITLHRGN